MTEKNNNNNKNKRPRRMINIAFPPSKYGVYIAIFLIVIYFIYLFLG